ncbi:tryptophan synthase subunit alpha [Candidatus Marinamargulisbacteria bacterium SCGC AG-414-C22]|nr:tryptophan synthase subunit alpha [Candidatus Marinamargulisbacteria bacterium SCGC AG-414-C22]
MPNLAASFKSDNTLIPYITFGDPNPEFTLELCDAVLSAGADILEIGLPFSDPIADGPVVQKSHQRALINKHNVKIEHALTATKKLTDKHNKPVVFMGSVNLVLQFGIESFFKQAQAAGLAGIILPDMSFEASEPYTQVANKYHVPIIFLVSPLCSDERLQQIVTASSGFIYLISTTGITGERESIDLQLATIIQKIRAIKDIPIAIGFGISRPDHVETVNSIADGAIVGSHLIKIIDQYHNQPEVAKQAFVKRIKELKSL